MYCDPLGPTVLPERPLTVLTAGAPPDVSWGKVSIIADSTGGETRQVTLRICVLGPFYFNLKCDTLYWPVRPSVVILFPDVVWCVWHQSTTIGTNQRPYCNVRFPQCVRNKCFFLFSYICARPLCTLANTNRRTRPKHFTDQWTQQLTSFPTVKVWPRLKHLTGRTRSRRAAAHPEKKAPQIKYPRQFRACRPL